MRCNTFTNNAFAMNINPITAGFQQLPNQGVCGQFDKQAGNKFVTSCSASNNPIHGNAFKTVFNTIIAIEQQYLSVFDLSYAQLQALRAIAAGDTNAKLYAQGILEARGENAIIAVVDPNEEEQGQGKMQVLKTTYYNNDKLNIFPNPSDGTAKITWNLERTHNINGTLQIIDMQGKVYQKWSINASNSSVDLDTIFLPSGIYIIKLNTNDIDLTDKLIINK